MITLNLLKHLETLGFGTIDDNLLWQKMTLDRDGLYISDLGGTNTRTSRKGVTFQIYSRANNDVKAFKQLQRVIDQLEANPVICELPGITGISEDYHNVTIMPFSSIANNGLDANGRTIYSTTGSLYYN